MCLVALHGVIHLGGGFFTGLIIGSYMVLVVPIFHPLLSSGSLGSTSCHVKRDALVGGEAITAMLIDRTRVISRWGRHI